MHPGGRYAETVRARAAGGEPVVVTAPTILESVTGLASRLARDPRLRSTLAWYRRLPFERLVTVLPFDGAAAVLAGDLRARQPFPPPRRRDTRSKPERRVAWVMDTQIAATVWTAGYGVATENRDDFELLSGLISELHPAAPPLEVAGPPAV